MSNNCTGTTMPMGTTAIAQDCVPVEAKEFSDRLKYYEKKMWETAEALNKISRNLDGRNVDYPCTIEPSNHIEQLCNIEMLCDYNLFMAEMLDNKLR